MIAASCNEISAFACNTVGQRVRASWGHSRERDKSKSLSHTPIADGPEITATVIVRHSVVLKPNSPSGPIHCSVVIQSDVAGRRTPWLAWRAGRAVKVHTDHSLARW